MNKVTILYTSCIKKSCKCQKKYRAVSEDGEKISGLQKINPTPRHQKSNGPSLNKLVCEFCNELFNSHVISKLRNRIRNASLLPGDKTTMYHYDSK